MSGPLLQPEEINELLKNNSHEPMVGLWEGTTAPFDFLKAGSKFEDKIPTLQELIERIIPKILNPIQEFAGEDIQINPVSEIKLEPATDVLAALHVEQQLVYQLKNEHDETEALIIVDRNLLFNLYNLMLGGKRFYVKSGNLTSLESAFLQKLVELVLVQFNHEWKNFGNYKFQLNILLTEQEQIQAIKWNADLFNLGLSFKIGDFEAKITGIFPKDILQNIGTTASADEQIEQETDPIWQQLVLQAVEDIEVPVRFTIGYIPTHLKNALQLQAGQELSLQLEPNGFPGVVNGLSYFRASMGKSGELRAVQVL